MQFVKRNMPAVISACGVLLNVLILSLIIPQMKNDIATMQGQSASIQSQVNAMQQSLLGINDKINGAGTAIAAFYSRLDDATQTLNTTETNIRAFSDSTQQELQQMSNTSATILAGFYTSGTLYQQQLNTSLILAQQQATVIQQEVAVAQANVVVALGVLQNQTTSSSQKLGDLFFSYSASMNASLEEMREINSSVVGVRDDFVERVMPMVMAEMQSLNQSVSALSIRVNNAETLSGGTMLTSTLIAIRDNTGTSAIVSTLATTPIRLSEQVFGPSGNQGVSIGATVSYIMGTVTAQVSGVMTADFL